MYAKALWDQRRSLPGWASAVLALLLLEAAMWPFVADMPAMDAYVQSLPPEFRDALALDQMGTGTGFLNAELFTLVLPVLLIVFAVARGARMVAGEEEAGTLDLLLVTPLSTTRLLVEAAAALATSVAVLGVAVLVGTWTGSALFGLGIGVGDAASGALAVSLVGLEFGILALVAGALTGRRSVAVAVSAVVALAAYLLHVGGVFVDGLAPWRGWSPFHQVLRDGPLGGGLPASYAWPVVVAAVAVLLVLPMWTRRDIGVA